MTMEGLWISHPGHDLQICCRELLLPCDGVNLDLSGNGVCVVSD